MSIAQGMLWSCGGHVVILHSVATVHVAMPPPPPRMRWWLCRAKLSHSLSLSFSHTLSLSPLLVGVVHPFVVVSNVVDVQGAEGEQDVGPPHRLKPHVR